MSDFRVEYGELNERFKQQVVDHRVAYGLDAFREIFVPMAFWPRIPVEAGQVGTVFIGMYPSQNWLRERDPGKKLKEANEMLSGGFCISLSTVWDLVFHLAIRQFLCPSEEPYCVTDVSKGAMESEDESPTRCWSSWYELLKDEMMTVLDGGRAECTRVIPVGRYVDRFLMNLDFGDWLKENRLGRLTGGITHWGAAAHKNPPRKPRSAFFKHSGQRVYALAEKMLDEADADPIWVQHLYGKLEGSQNPRDDWRCQWLFDKYRRELPTIGVADTQSSEPACPAPSRSVSCPGVEVQGRELEDDAWDEDYEDERDEEIEIPFGLVADLELDREDDDE